MRRMIWLIFWLWSALALAEPIKICTFVVAPYVLRQEGNAQGAIVSYYRDYLEPRWGRAFQWQIVNVARLLEEFKEGKCQMTPIFTKTAEREKLLHYSANSYVSFNPLLVVRSEFPLKGVQKPEDLFGLVIGWTKGAYPDFLKHPQIRIEEVTQLDWEQANLQKLSLKRLDAVYFSNQATAQYFTSAEASQWRLLPLPVPKIALYAAFAPTAQALREEYEPLAAEVFAAHPFEAYLQNYLATAKPPAP